MENCRFPNRLKKYRRLFCFSQKEVASMLGLKDTSPLSRWEKGISLPGLMHLFRLSQIYKTMPCEMYVKLLMRCIEAVYRHLRKADLSRADSNFFIQDFILI